MAADIRLPSGYPAGKTGGQLKMKKGEDVIKGKDPAEMGGISLSLRQLSVWFVLISVPCCSVCGSALQNGM